MNAVTLFDKRTRQWLSFSEPLVIYAARTLDEVLPALRAVEAETQAGRWAAGYVAYEAGSAFDPALTTHPASDFPLVWFGIYDKPASVSIRLSAPASVAISAPLHWQASIDAEAYRHGFEQVKAHIARGETYQVNFSFRLRSPFEDDPWQLFARMATGQGEGYCAFIDMPDWAICSASPELFFTLEGETLTSMPMKGTAARGLRLADDLAQAEWLRHSEKNRAENVMIVDMVRNDMGRIARIGTVNVPRLFDVEKYSTVWQMTTTVTCQTPASIPDIFRALFPAASITGAPKARTMQIITTLENAPRQIYTGAIGYIAPGRVAQFSVAIRTVLIDKARKMAEYGIGGGLVWDSENASEFEECYTKARILTHTPPQFDLLETILWQPEYGYMLLNEHISRMKESAEYFSYTFPETKIRQKLKRLEKSFAQGQVRVRLTLARDGEISVAAQALAPLPHPYRVRLAKNPINSRDVTLYHKTTHRKVYEQALSDCPDADDILLWNERGELTESCIANLLLEKDGEWFTPPLECGLLAGTARGQLISEHKVKEKVINIESLPEYDRICLINSVRGMWEVCLLPEI